MSKILQLFGIKKEDRCKHRHTREEHPQCFPLETKSGQLLPKILVFDIEAFPIIASVWKTGKTVVSPDSIVKPSIVLGWSAKWLFSEKVMSDILTRKEALDWDDSRVLKGIWDLLNEADIVIAHNGDRYDIKMLNARFIINGYKPTLPYRTIDTLKVARSRFKFDSASLGFLAKILGLESQKIHTSWSLWEGCMRGDKESLNAMRTYCDGDVLTLEEIYVKLRPWMKSHPNLAMYMDLEEPVCSICANTDLNWVGEYKSDTNIYKTFICKNCSSVGRLRKPEPKTNNKKLTKAV